jgi:acetyl esterase/lipase
MLFHGFRGNEQNLNLAQATHCAGYDVLTTHHRGAWGNPGSFSFTHALEDSDVAITFPKVNAAQFHIDAGRIFVVGHSMGGWIAAAAHDPAVAGAVLISAADMGTLGRGSAIPPHARRRWTTHSAKSG